MRRAIRGVDLMAISFLLASVLVGATGCAVGRHEMAEVTDLPESFGASGDGVVSGKWWLDFDDPGLSAVIDHGLSGSPDLAVWWDRLDQAEALSGKAGASWWPAVNVEGTASRSREWGDDIPEVYRNSYSAEGRASYEIDLWGRVRSTRHAAVHDAHGSREDLRAAAMSLSAQIASTWYEVAEARAQISVRTEQLDANEKMLELIRLRFRGGQVGAADVLRQDQLLESSRGNLALAESRLEVLRNQLAVLVGRVPEEHVDDEGATLVELPPLPAAGVPLDLLKRRPDLKAAELDVAAASARLGAAVADRFPRLSISGSVSSGASTAGDLFTGWLSNLVGNLTMPLFDGGNRKAEAERQEAIVQESIHRYRQTVLTALKEVEDALVLERQQSAYLASVSAQLALADAVLERTMDSYRGGHVDYLRVLESLISQQSLARQKLTAARQLIVYRINLCRALSGGWNPERPARISSGSDVRTQQ